MTETESLAREIVKKWQWDCGSSLDLTFVQSELLEQRIVELVSDIFCKLYKDRK